MSESTPPVAGKWTVTSSSCEQTMAIGAAVALHAQPGDVIALIGELGAGKTQLVRGLAQGLGIDPRHVSSPTFVLVHEYDRPLEEGAKGDGETLALVHMDAYRLRDADDLATVGWDALTGEAARRDRIVLAVEWADRIADHLPDDRLTITLEHAADDTRRVTLTAHGAAWRERMGRLGLGDLGT